MNKPDVRKLGSEIQRELYRIDLNELFEERFKWSSYLYKSRLFRIISLIKSNFQDKTIRILDLGCAQGNFTILLTKEGFGNIIGSDIRVDFLKYAKLKSENFESYSISSGYTLPFKDNEFDTVILSEVIEHLKYPERILSEIRRVLKRKGTLIISSPTRKRLISKSIGYKEFLLQRERIIADSTYKGSDHIFEFSKTEFEEFLSENKFKPMDTYFEGCIPIFIFTKLLEFIKADKLCWLININERFFYLLKEYLFVDIIVYAKNMKE